MQLVRTIVSSLMAMFSTRAKYIASLSPIATLGRDLIEVKCDLYLTVVQSFIDQTWSSLHWHDKG